MTDYLPDGDGSNAEEGTRLNQLGGSKSEGESEEYEGLTVQVSEN